MPKLCTGRLQLQGVLQHPLQHGGAREVTSLKDHPLSVGRFVKHFAEDRTVITPCAIPVNSSKEDVSHES